MFSVVLFSLIKQYLATDRIILGIDPGTNIMGYGIIHLQGNTIRLITMGVLKLAKYENHPLKLKKIFERTVGLIEEYHPDEMALEAPFFGKNVQSMLKLGRAQGVAMAAGLHKSVPIFEYSPKKVKQSIVGNGSASKEQVAAMLKNILNFKEIPKYLDATDGLAVAVCHYFQGNKPQTDKNYNGWKNFISEHPERTK